MEGKEISKQGGEEWVQYTQVYKHTITKGYRAGGAVHVKPDVAKTSTAKFM